MMKKCFFFLYALSLLTPNKLIKAIKYEKGYKKEKHKIENANRKFYILKIDFSSAHILFLLYNF